MAQKDITIRIKTVETQLNKSLKKIEKLENIINKLNSKKVKLNTSPAQKAAEKLRKEIEKGNKIVDKLFDSGRSSGFGNSIAKVNNQLSLVTKSFNAANSAADRQTRATALIAGNLKKMRMEAAAFAGASGNREALKAGAGNVGTRLTEIREFPKTILAGSKAMTILNGMLELAEVNSQEFLDISKAIGEQLKQNAKIQEAADKASGVSKKKRQLKDSQRTNQRIKAIREQTLNIERRIQDSTLNQATKDQLINNLKRSGLELDRKELELAKQINIETQRNLTMQEKMQRRRGRIAQSALIGGGFPLLFGGGPLQAAAGALGGGIGEAISPGGGFAGSIAATAAISSLGQFANSARELAEAVKTTSGTLELMETRSLFSSDAIKKQAKALQDQGKEAELAALLTDELTKALGPAGLGQLAGLAEQSEEMNRQFGILKTSMELFISGPLTKLIKILNNVVGKANIVNQLDQSLGQLKKENPNEFKRIINRLERGNLKDQLNPFSSQARSQVGSLINPSNLQVQGIPVGGFGKDILRQILQDVNKQLPAATLPFQTNLDTGNGGNGGSGGSKDFSKFDLNILDQRIALQKLSGGLLNEDVVNRKRGIIFAEAALQLAQAEGNAGKIAIIQKERLLKLNQLDLEVDKAKGKAFAENVLKPQMDAIDKQEKTDFDSGAALGKRLASEVKIINNLDKEIEKMGLLTQLEEAKTIEEKVNIQLKLQELELGQEIHDVNKQDMLDLLKKKEAFIENNKLLTEQKQIAKDIKNTFAVEMSTAIKGLITGANNLNDALRNVLNKMADAFLNIGLFGNAGGSLKKDKGLLGTLFGGLLATGGPAKAGKSYIVGEQGPELFTPGVSGMVSPNNALGGSTNVVVNVDASGSSVEGDEQQGKELGQLISVAIQSELIKQKRPGGLLG
jgi:hypothetical protein